MCAEKLSKPSPPATPALMPFGERVEEVEVLLEAAVEAVEVVVVATLVVAVVSVVVEAGSSAEEEPSLLDEEEEELGLVVPLDVFVAVPPDFVPIVVTSIAPVSPLLEVVEVASEAEVEEEEW
jgi:hypothetical protein